MTGLFHIYLNYLLEKPLLDNINYNLLIYTDENKEGYKFNRYSYLNPFKDMKVDLNSPTPFKKAMIINYDNFVSTYCYDRINNYGSIELMNKIVSGFKNNFKTVSNIYDIDKEIPTL